MNSMIASFKPLKGDPPAVVLGDLDLVRPLAMRRIPVVLATSDPDDIALRSRHLAGHAILRGAEGTAERAESLIALGARLSGELGARLPLFYGSDQDLGLLYRYRPELSRYYLFLINDEALAW